MSIRNISSSEQQLAARLEKAADTQHKQKAGRQEGQTKNQKTAHQAIKPPRHRDTTTPRHPGAMLPSTVVETLRKAVIGVGKEAATHRFTPEEKRAIADIVYTYGRQGYKTSENEVARVAINWLVMDYQENGTKSVLDKVLKALRG
jgi:hypothetical protein